MNNKPLTKTQKRKLLFEQTCKYITSLGFDGPYDEEGYGHIDFHYPDENIHLNLRRSSMDLCSTKLNWADGTSSFSLDSRQGKLETKIELFIENQKEVLSLNI